MAPVPNVASIADSVNSRPEAVTLSKGISVTRAKQPVQDSSIKGEQIDKDRRLRSIDVLFILDATRGMQDFDIVPGAEYQPFTYDVEAFRRSVDAIRAHSDIPPGKGQVDEPEDVFTGLEMALGMDWKSRERAVIHIGNEPAHGKAYHDLPPSRPQSLTGHL